ncbi:MAG: hypothetical protein C0425_06165 [Chlorobiaceae bacterium]|nr:hypothetical protein [Chlorobiaceae bacterium]
MKKRIIYLSAISVLFLFSSIVVFTGCQQKAEEPEQSQTTIEQTPEQAYGTEQAAKPEEIEPTVELEGTWTGTFWNKNMTLVIATQTAYSFEGETTVRWTKPVVSKVKGTIDPATLEMKFQDVVDGKDAGSYTGKLSEDKKSFTGQFKLNSGAGNPFNVKLKLQ